MSTQHPQIPLKPGEQYRFHFDMTKCIGCKCCEVACHEQNNNPANVDWRKVGEIEGGEFPFTVRLHVSMACNHCLEPSCLQGCPVDAYFKDEITGAVRLRDDACIGCGYCTWNCPYSAPQFNFERRMVTKCDLCHNRLIAGDLPACVSACPSGALEIEAVNQQEWRKDHALADAPSLPPSHITISTTRITQSANEGIDMNRADSYRLRPEKPHTSLVFMTVLTQLSVGGFMALFFADMLSRQAAFGLHLQEFLKIGPGAMLGTAALALGTSVFHLGRPIFAFRALKMWRRSWISREVLFFSLFAGLATLYSFLRWQEAQLPAPLMLAIGCVVLVFGILGIYSSARIYMVPARPSWNNIRTPIAFFATSLILGPLVTLWIFAWQARVHSVVLLASGAAIIAIILVAVILIAGLMQLASILIKLFYILSRDDHELRASAKLLTQNFRFVFLVRLGLLVISLLGIALSLIGLMQPNGWSPIIVFWICGFLFMSLLSELLGRYLFFVSVVPKNRPEGYHA